MTRSADARFVALSTSKMMEVFAWQDAGMTFEAALAKVEEASVARVVESQQQVQESQGEAAYAALFGSDAAPTPAGSGLRESASHAASDPYEALFGRGGE